MLDKISASRLLNPLMYDKNNTVHDLILKNTKTGKTAVIPKEWILTSGKIRKKFKNKYLAILLDLKTKGKV